MSPGTGASGRFDSAHGTHASFGARGDRVIVTYHGDHAYSFDVTAAGGDPVAVYGDASAPAGAAEHVATLITTQGLTSAPIATVNLNPDTIPVMTPSEPPPDARMCDEPNFRWQLMHWRATIRTEFSHCSGCRCRSR